MCEAQEVTGAVHICSFLLFSNKEHSLSLFHAQESYGEFVTSAVLKDCKGDLEQAIQSLLVCLVASLRHLGVRQCEEQLIDKLAS